MEKDYDIKTSRLGLRNWVEEDKIPFAKLNSNPTVMRFFPSILSKEKSDDLVDRLMLEYDNEGFTFYAADELSTGNFMGFIGLAKTKIETSFTPCVEIGWRLDEEFWGKGYATEGALASLDHGFDMLGIEEIYSYTPTVNTPSERVMRKIGMMKIGEFDHPLIERGHRLERHVIYNIKKTIL